MSKKKGGLDKIILGFVIGSAVAGAVGAGLKTEKGQKVKEDALKKISDTGDKVRDIINEKESRKGFWHFLNKIFFKKK